MKNGIMGYDWLWVMGYFGSSGRKYLILSAIEVTSRMRRMMGQNRDRKRIGPILSASH